MKEFADMPMHILEARNRAEMQDFGRLLTNEEREKNRQMREMESRGITAGECFRAPRRYENATFETFECDNDKERAVVEHMRSGKSAVLYGSNGTGKTHLAIAACRHQFELGKSVKYTTVFELFSEIKQSFGGGDPMRIVEQYSGYGYLVIDEIDKAYGTETEFLYFYQIVNRRYNEMRHTVIITNADRQSLPKVVGVSTLDRIASDGKLIEMTGENYRQKRA